MNPRITRTRAAIGGGAAIVAATAVAVSLSLTHGTTAAPAAPARASLIASSCGGPKGAAYVADSGWDGFSAINTANCKIIQTYNVGDPQVPGNPGDYDYASTDEGVAIHGSTLYFADAGDSAVAVIDAAKLSAANYNPPETDIHTGDFPEDLAVTPDGSQLWVANTGAQASASSVTSVSVIDTKTLKVVATIPTRGAPSQVAFSASGARAYVTTADGLYIFSTKTHRRTGFVAGLGDPRSVAVAPDGMAYVTESSRDSVAVISPSGHVTTTIAVGVMPWDVVISADGKTAYVANPDSDSISVISTASRTVTATVSVPGDPDTLGLTADGSQLWIGQLSLAYVTLLDTRTDTVAGRLNLGGSTAQSADGYGPSGIALTSTPTPGS